MLYTFLCLLPVCLSHQYPPEVYTILFGDLSFDDMFLPETADGNLTEEEYKTIENYDVEKMLRKSYLKENMADFYEDMSNITVDGLDTTEYNDISVKLYNFTRKRIYSELRNFVDPDDYWHGDYPWAIQYEQNKIMSIQKLCLTLLYHARYKIESAFKQRESIRNDKRYKLGYLFNRLRRLKTEMLKVVAVGKEQHEWNAHRNLTSLMRLYERVVYFDVDIRDSTAYIKQIFDKKEAFDYEDPSVTNADGQYRVTPKMAAPPHGMPPPAGQSAQSLGDDYYDDLKALAG